MIGVNSKVYGMNDLVKKIQGMDAHAKAQGHPRFAVTYDTPYALVQHENLEYFHPVGQAKFLEEPTRTRAKEIGRRVRDVYKTTRSLRRAVRAGTNLLKWFSQQLCPVLTGRLRASAEVIELK
jgi:hypothetical protein